LGSDGWVLRDLVQSFGASGQGAPLPSGVGGHYRDRFDPWSRALTHNYVNCLWVLVVGRVGAGIRGWPSRPLRARTRAQTQLTLDVNFVQSPLPVGIYFNLGVYFNRGVYFNLGVYSAVGVYVSLHGLQRATSAMESVALPSGRPLALKTAAFLYIVGTLCDLSCLNS
jgi:hypothetical protein